jgi:hypothetical protein
VSGVRVRPLGPVAGRTAAEHLAEYDHHAHDEATATTTTTASATTSPAAASTTASATTTTATAATGSPAGPDPTGIHTLVFPVVGGACRLRSEVRRGGLRAGGTARADEGRAVSASGASAPPVAGWGAPRRLNAKGSSAAAVVDVATPGR